VLGRLFGGCHCSPGAASGAGRVGRHSANCLLSDATAFLIALGGQFMNYSQTLILTRLLGLKAAAVWTVCTKIYPFFVQTISRFLITQARPLPR